MTQLWNHGRNLHPIIARYTVGHDTILDEILLPYDIEASKAHVDGLVKIKVLTVKEGRVLKTQLGVLLSLWKKERVFIRVEDEDCHTVIENYLVRTCGSVGKKIHTGRSRNDQVLVALRLYMRDQLTRMSTTALEVAKVFLAKAERHAALPFPGYSHTQQAMPTSLGHYYASFVESLLDDIELTRQVLKHINKNPLGTAAGFGVTFPLDRLTTTRILGFDGMQTNSLYAQNSRGKSESAYIECLVQIMLTLGKFANDLLLFTSREYDFFAVDELVTTGSTIMPQKRNLDGLEILRSHVHTLIGNQHAVQNMATGVLSGYNRDFQLMKKPLMESSEIAFSSIEVARLYLIHSHPKKDVIRCKIVPDILAADRANMLVQEKGTPFRDAHRLVSEHLGKEGEPLSVTELLANIKSKISVGAPGNLQLAAYKKRIRNIVRALSVSRK